VTTVVIAHRTCPRDATENSLAGIRAAADSGAEVVEIDVRLTSDRQPVLMHDPRLWRMTHRARRLDHTSLAELRRLRLRGSDEPPPTLAEALAALAEHQQVAIDVKDPAASDAVLTEVRNHRLEHRAKFWAKSTTAVAFAAGRSPDVERALLRDARRPDDVQRFLDDAGRCMANAISAHWSIVSRAFVDEARSRGLRVYAWCKTARIDERKLVLLDGVVTDWPVAARSLLDRSHA
jgi:glycerophosphoryl diester phosphodiesterase